MKTLPLDQYLPGVSTLAYGCMWLGGGWGNDPITQADIQLAHEMVDASLESGINFFDHADIYTSGKAEQVFGEVLKARPQLREQMFLQSKCAIRFDDESGPGRYDFSAQWIEQSVDGILRRLNTEYLDILLLHRPDPLMEPAEVAEIFNKLKSTGKVKHFGVSNMQQHQMAFLQHHLDMPIVANQIEISLQKTAWLDEGVTAGSEAGNQVNFAPGTLEYCQLNGVQIQSWGSLCRGLYSGKDVSGEAQAVKDTADLVARLSAEYGVSKEAILLAFLTRHPAAIQPIIGSTSPDRVKACADVAKVSLSREHWYSLYVSARGERLP